MGIDVTACTLHRERRVADDLRAIEEGYRGVAVAADDFEVATFEGKSRGLVGEGWDRESLNAVATLTVSRVPVGTPVELAKVRVRVAPSTASLEGAIGDRGFGLRPLVASGAACLGVAAFERETSLGVLKAPARPSAIVMAARAVRSELAGVLVLVTVLAISALRSEVGRASGGITPPALQGSSQVRFQWGERPFFMARSAGRSLMITR